MKRYRGSVIAGEIMADYRREKKWKKYCKIRAEKEAYRNKNREINTFQTEKG